MKANLFHTTTHVLSWDSVANMCSIFLLKAHQHQHQPTIYWFYRILPWHGMGACPFVPVMPRLSPAIAILSLPYIAIAILSCTTACIRHPPMLECSTVAKCLIFYTEKKNKNVSFTPIKSTHLFWFWPNFLSAISVTFCNSGMQWRVWGAAKQCQA